MLQEKEHILIIQIIADFSMETPKTKRAWTDEYIPCPEKFMKTNLN